MHAANKSGGCCMDAICVCSVWSNSSLALVVVDLLTVVASHAHVTKCPDSSTGRTRSPPCQDQLRDLTGTWSLTKMYGSLCLVIGLGGAQISANEAGSHSDYHSH